MKNRLRQELSGLEHQVECRKEIEKELSLLNEMEDSLRKQEYQQRNRLNKEKSDVALLEKRSLKTFFYSLTGKIEPMLEKERFDVHEAETMHRDALGSLEECRVKLRSAKAALQSYDGLEVRIRDKYDELKEYMKTDPEHGKEVEDLDRYIDELDRRIRDIDRAMGAASLARGEAREIVSMLDSASSLGVWDAAGGGMVATAAKQKKLDQVRERQRRLQERIGVLRNALKDLDVGLPIYNVNTMSTLKGADFIFDGLLVDLTVQGRINDSRGETRSVLDKISHVYGKLESMKNTYRHERDKAAGLLDTLIRVK
ncbi:MAG: hypothetical protein IJF53_04280 [Clostridia bacterium]|nr:hypothetical protein [Clostridia bacterium]